MDGYETDGSSALDPVFNDDSNLDNQWSADASGTGLRAIRGGGQGGPASDRGNFSVVKGGKTAARNAEARNAGRAAENGASTGVAGQDAKNLENSPFVNNVVGKDDKDRKKKRGKGFMRAVGPSGILISLIGVLVALVAGSQWLFPFALVANGLEQFNVLRTSMNRRSGVFMRAQLDPARTRKFTSTKYGIFGAQEFKVSETMQKRFARNGITYIDDADGNGLRLLYYEDRSGKRMAVVANPEDVDSIPSRIKVGDTEVDINWKGDLTAALDTDNDFFKSTKRSTSIMGGTVAGWFDSASDAFHKVIGNIRDKFTGISKTADPEEVQTAARKGILGTTVNGIDSDDAKLEDVEKDKITHKEEVVYKPLDTETDGSMKPGDNIEKVLTDRAKKRLVNAGKGATYLCMILKAFGAINLTVSALQVVQILNYIGGFLEAIDRTKIGDGGNEINYYMGPEGWSNTGPTTDSSGRVIEGKEASNAMLAAPTRAFFGASPVSPTDPSAEKFNTEYATAHAITSKFNGGSAELNDALNPGYEYNKGEGASFVENISKAATGAGAALLAFRACNAVKAVVGGVSLASDFVQLIKGVGKTVVGSTVMIFSKAIEIIKGIINAGKYVAASAAVGILVSAIVPFVAQWLEMDLISNMVGEDPAYALGSGFNIYAGRQMQRSSGLPGNMEQVAAQFRETQKVIAEEARYDRLTHSPFDVTNKNTFLGSLAYSMIPVATTMKFSSLFSTVSQVANTVGSSIVSLLPSVKAAGEETWYTLSMNDSCPMLSVNGLVGDAYCNPYFVSDYSTVDVDPAEVFESICEGNFVQDCDAEGEPVVVDGVEYAYTPEVKEDSEYGKWIVSCALRESQFGYADDRLANWNFRLPDTGNPTLNMVVEQGIGLIPLVGDALDLLEAGEAEANIGWTTGEKCLSSEYAMYSRYSEDQRMLEAAGLIAESAVTAFTNKYYEQYPLDNSLEGVIARYSGMSLAQVNEALDVIAYATYVANYDATERGPMKPTEQQVEQQPNFENDEVIVAAHYIVDYNKIEFDDLRRKIQIA